METPTLAEYVARDLAQLSGHDLETWAMMDEAARLRYRTQAERALLAIADWASGYGQNEPLIRGLRESGRQVWSLADGFGNQPAKSENR